MICMAELTQAEKTKYWSDIKLQWKIVKGEEKGEPARAQQQINILQEKLGVEVTDFNEKIETPTKELEEYTVAKAESNFTDDQMDIISDGLDIAIAFREIVADLTVKKYPKLKGNPAGIGQMVNITYDLVKDKLK